MRIKGRLERLEKRADTASASQVTLWQDDNDPELFLGDGRTYRRGDCDWPENALVITYNRNWRE